MVVEIQNTIIIDNSSYASVGNYLALNSSQQMDAYKIMLPSRQVSVLAL